MDADAAGQALNSCTCFGALGRSRQISRCGGGNRRTCLVRNQETVIPSKLEPACARVTTSRSTHCTCGADHTRFTEALVTSAVASPCMPIRSMLVLMFCSQFSALKDAPYASLQQSIAYGRVSMDSGGVIFSRQGRHHITVLQHLLDSP